MKAYLFLMPKIAMERGRKTGTTPPQKNNTFAPSYTGQATTAVWEVAAQAEQRKCTKYSALPVTYIFVPVAIETAAVMGSQSLRFLRNWVGVSGSRLGTLMPHLPCCSVSLYGHPERELCLYFRGPSGVTFTHFCSIPNL